MRIKIIFITILIAAVSCEDLLEVQPSASLETETAISDKNDLENGLSGCYDAMQSSGYYGRSFINLAELTTDNAYNGGTIKEYGQLNNNVILEDNNLIEGLWSSVYDAINRANNMIKIVNTMEGLSETEKQSYLGELHFLRALHYFNLVKSFGQVPLKLEPTEGLGAINTPLSEESAIFESVINDLIEADGTITNTDNTRATNLAVKMLLSKVYLYQEKWEDVISLSTEIIQEMNTPLEPNFSNLFDSEDSPEVLFQVSFDDQDKNRLAEYYFPNPLTGRYEVAPESSFVEAFETGDERLDVTIQFADELPYCNKYSEISTGADNVIVFRLAEAYLNRAEARANFGGDFNDIKTDLNMIRNRAGLTDTDASNNYDELLQAIENERRFEFAFEGHRWFDLVRTGRAIDVLPNVSSVDQYHFPIPLAETSTNESID